jgi:hypothetical protein
MVLKEPDGRRNARGSSSCDIIFVLYIRLYTHYPGYCILLTLHEIIFVLNIRPYTYPGHCILLTLHELLTC